MKKLSLIVFLVFFACIDRSYAATDWSFKLTGTADTLNGAAGRMQAELDWRRNGFHAFVSPDFGYGTADYWTFNMANWSGVNYAKRSVFTAQEIYGDYSFWRFNTGLGYRLFDTGAVDVSTSLDVNPVDILDLDQPRLMAQQSLWGEYSYGRLRMQYVQMRTSEGKLPVDKSNPWRPDHFNFPLQNGTHGGGNFVNWLRLSYARDVTSYSFMFYDGQSPFQNFQVNSHFEADYYPKRMVSGVFGSEFRGIRFKFGAGYNDRDEWLDDSFDFEGTVWKRTGFHGGYLEWSLGSVQRLVVDRGEDYLENKASLWRKLSPENLYVGSQWLGLSYSRDSVELGLRTFISNRGGWKLNPAFDWEFMEKTHFRIEGAVMDDFYERYRNNNYATLSLSRHFGGK